MDFTAPSFSLGFDSDDDEPAPPVGSDRREQPRGYAAPDAPSFSLGIDFDDGVDEEPRLPGRREEQARRSAAPDPPSFSLGFDDDVEEESRSPAGGRREERARRSAAPDSPSFSLGFDDDSIEEEARSPAAGRRKERPRGSAAPDSPSFSLGFDDDDDCETLVSGQRHQQTRQQVAPPAPTSAAAEDEDDDFVLAGAEQPPSVTNRFKRLRKGPAPARPAPTPQVRRRDASDTPSFSLGISDDDDVFLADGQHQKQPRAPVAPGAPSSFIAGDRRPELAQRETTPLKQLQKDPLKVPGSSAGEVSPVMSENKALGAVGTGSLEDDIEDWTTDEDRPVQDIPPPSVGSCSTSSNSKFSLLHCGVLMTQSSTKANTSKFTHTPNFSASKSLEESCTKKLLPKITVSPMRKIHLLDSDTDADDEQNQIKAKKENMKPKGSTTVQKSEAVMNNNLATPAFDEFCTEYFKNTKDTGSSQQKERNSFCCPKVSQPKYPDEMERHFQQQSTSSGGVLDDNLDGRPPAIYYFFHHDPRVRDLVSGRLQHFIPTGAGSARENEQSRGESLSFRRQFRSSAAVNDDWVTPRRIPVPTDVGKRRVHANGTQSGSGHWFTNDSGTKVYVSKDGQELTGRDAYRQYQKESGRGFKRYKKKGSSTKGGAAKVKTEAAKQGTSRAKRKR